MGSIISIETKRVSDFKEDVDLTTENIFTDIIEDIGDGIVGAIDFLKHTVTLDLYKYFEDRHNSEIALNLLRAKRYAVNNKVDFTNKYGLAIDDNVYTAIGFDVRLKPLVELLDSSFEEFIDTHNALVEEFNVEIGKIISSETYRMGKDSLSSMKDFTKKVNTEASDRIVDIDEKILGILGVDTKAKLKVICPTSEELLDNLTTVDKVFKATKERDLKEMLKAISGLTNRISTLEDLIEKDMVSKEMEEVFNTLVIHFANSTTIVGKLYHVLYETATTLTNIVNLHIKS